MEQVQKELSKQWGDYMRSPYRAFPRRSVLGRIQEEGWGAASGGLKDYVPADRMCPEPVLFIHRAWHSNMTEPQKVVFYLRFAAKGSPEHKAKTLGIKRTRFHEILGEAMGKIPW